MRDDISYKVPKGDDLNNVVDFVSYLDNRSILVAIILESIKNKD